MASTIGSPGVVVGVDGCCGGGAHFRFRVAAVDRIHFKLGRQGVFDAAVGHAPARTAGTGNRLQKGIVSRKFFVVLLQTLHGRPLNAVLDGGRGKRVRITLMAEREEKKERREENEKEKTLMAEK